ncbi:uncharacterized protein LOC123682250 [Harmonia axyridis]|uniref:uncharacterized protein LOC123682250 n=1 Tax=Harmonia axyridis TaxID=115357 RepID=UPI001E277669|nr:uncharacterized protein LOC123682250 [Harmonia axyridis]
MERYTPEQRSEIVDLFYKNNCSFVSTLRNLRRIHGRHFSISRPTVRRFVDKFESKSSDPTKVPVRQRNARTKENIDLVAASVKENPNLSIPRRSQQLNLSQTTTWRILRNDLGLHAEHEAHQESDLDNLDKSHSSDASVDSINEGIEMKSQNKPCRSRERNDKETSETDETSSAQNQENTAPNPNSPPVALNQNSTSPRTAAPVSPDPSGRSSSPSEPLSPVSSYVSSSSES